MFRYVKITKHLKIIVVIVKAAKVNNDCQKWLPFSFTVCHSFCMWYMHPAFLLFGLKSEFQNIVENCISYVGAYACCVCPDKPPVKMAKRPPD